jgi:hypothetical protein
MDIEQLKKIIEDNLKDKVFSLDTAILNSPGITVIANHYLPGGILKFSDASIASSDSNSITITGKGADLPFKDMTIASAKFYILQSNVALTMQATGDKDWTLDKAIPAFKNTLGASVRFATGSAAPAFYLLSDEDEGRPIGLTFTGIIDFKTMDSGISSLLGIEKESVTGPIQMKNGGVEFVSIDFDGPEVKNVDLWLAKDCAIEFKMESYILPNPISNSAVAIPNITLVTDIPFSASGNEYHLPLSVQVINLTEPIRFSADITQLIDASLDAIGKFIGGVNLKGTIPPSFHIEEYVKFESLFVDFDVNGKSVSAIGLEIKSATPWTIVRVASTGKTFDARNIFLSFNVMDPFTEAKRAYLSIGGEITLTDRAALFISASYPNFQILGCLTDDSVLSIKEFISQFVGDPSGVPELLYVDQLSFDLSSGNYVFEIGVGGFWEINSQKSGALIIEQLSFAVQYTKEVQTASFLGKIRVDTIDITVTADYSATEGKKGWIFTGETGKDQRIEIRDFVNYLAETFHAGEPPEWIQGISLQDLSIKINTLDKSFDFSVTGNIPIAANNELKIIAGFKMEALEGGYEKKLTGIFYIGKSEFKFELDSKPSNTTVSAGWKAVDEKGYIQFEDIAHAFGFKEVPTIPDGLKLSLKEAKFYYDFDANNPTLVLAAASANYGNAVFVAKKIDAEWKYVFGIDIKININLDQLPLVGSDLASVAGNVGLNGSKLIGATKEIKEPEVVKLNKLIKDNAGAEYPTLPELKEGIETGVYCAIEFDLGNNNKYDLQISTAKKKAPDKTLLLAAADTPAKDDNAYWIELQKTIGPVYFDKAGVAYKDGRVALLLDASLIFTALKIDLIELGVSNPLNKLDPNFELAGLSIAYQSGPVQIAAGFLKQVVDDVTEYSGTAVIGIKTFNLSAMGSYASVDGHPSLFIFALLSSPPLGGPPAFFVTGVAAGFGYNRGLKLPTIDTVPKFPLVMGFVPNQESPFKGPDPGEALKVLVKDKVVPVQIGQNWVAAGLRFTSFELLESFALLSVAFGTNLEIGIIGMSTVSVPPKSPVVVAYAQLALNAAILPDKGFVGIEAKLTPASFLLSKSCLLTGGFAFYLWTSPSEFEGDFVVTLGGYHPNFNPPAHYPKVPRLGFNWVVTREVTIKGGMYFALTPTCVMAGGALEATFSSGDLRAWFIIGADFLIAWKPYSYDARLYLSFGVAYTFRLDLLFTTITVTISVSLGADLHIWGPEFSGVATIHLWIISFDISFGAAAQKPVTTISWKEFRESFLPASEKTLQHQALYGDAVDKPIPTDTDCIGKVSKGLVEDLTLDEKDHQGISWIVNRNNTTLETYTIIPAKEYSIVIKDKNGTHVPEENIVFTNQDKLDGRNKDFGVGMVNVESADFKSKHSVTLTFEGVLNLKIKYEVFAIIRNVQKALWEKRVVGYSKDSMVKNVLTGFRITPRAPVPEKSVPIELENFKYHYQDYFKTIVPAKPILVQGPENKDGMKVLKDTINTKPASEMRDQIVSSLIKRGVKLNANINVKQIAERAEDFIMAPPVLSYSYWKKPV